MNINEMTRDEKSMLLYIETCNVDGDCLLVASKMNVADIEAMKKFQQEGLLLRSGRIPYRMLQNNGLSVRTHYAELTDAGWELAHQLRKQRSLNKGDYAKSVFEAVEERATA